MHTFEAWMEFSFAIEIKEQRRDGLSVLSVPSTSQLVSSEKKRAPILKAYKGRRSFRENNARIPFVKSSRLYELLYKSSIASVIIGVIPTKRFTTSSTALY